MTNSESAVPAIAKEERDWAMFGHLSAFLAYLTIIGGILGPLVIWLLRKEDKPFAAAQAKESLNFQITVLLIGLLCLPLCLIGIGFLLLGLLALANLILVIVAAIKASEGVAYRYPFSLRLVS